MKIQLTFKASDIKTDKLDKIRENLAESYEDYTEEAEDEVFDEVEKAERAINKFIQYGEYCTIEIDTETKEARVMPVR